MLYFRWSKGFKSGGWTTRLSKVIASGADAQFGPEKATSYEGGFKSEWFGHRLVLNGAGFYSKFTEMQLNQQVGPSPVLKNLGDSDIFGGELEAQADIGNGFMLNANVGYIDAEYTRLDPSVVAVDGAGAVVPQESIFLNSKLPKTPEVEVQRQSAIQCGSREWQIPDGPDDLDAHLVDVQRHAEHRASEASDDGYA